MREKGKQKTGLIGGAIGDRGGGTCPKKEAT
jgi:hypothetical protein